MPSLSSITIVVSVKMILVHIPTGSFAKLYTGFPINTKKITFLAHLDKTSCELLAFKNLSAKGSVKVELWCRNLKCLVCSPARHSVNIIVSTYYQRIFLRYDTRGSNILCASLIWL